MVLIVGDAVTDIVLAIEELPVALFTESVMVNRPGYAKKMLTCDEVGFVITALEDEEVHK